MTKNLSEREKWDRRYRESDGREAQAARVLSENLHLLPATGRALDLACGLAANALLLAEHGLETHAWDFSPAAVEQVRARARERGLRIVAEVRDVVRRPPEPASFDVIVVSRFLERALVPFLEASLKPKGLLFYQTFTKARVDDTGPANELYRLAENELPRMFSSLRILVYREEGLVGDIRSGFRNEALLVACKKAGA